MRRAAPGLELAGRQRHGPSRYPASGCGKEAAPGLGEGPPASPRPQEPRGLRDPVPRAGRWVRSSEPPAVPLAREGGKEGETRFSKHPGKDEGGSGKLAASSRSRLRSPSFILPEIISFTENICLHY